MESINVYFLYSCVLALACLFSYYSEKITIVKDGMVCKSFNNTAFFISFLILVLFCSFTDTGVDYYNYYYKIETRSAIEDVARYRDIEPLFTLWAHYGMQLFGKPHLVIVSMKVVTLVLMFISFYMMRKEMDSFVAVCAYASISYLTSFTLIRIVLASAFVTLAFVLLMKKKNILWFLVTMLIGTGLHFSCIMPLIAIATYYLAFKYGKGKQSKNFLIVLLVISILIVLTQIISLMDVFIESSESFEHYQKYVDKMKDSSSLGTLAVVLISYVLVFYMLNKVRIIEKDNARFYLMLVFAIYATVFEFLGTRVPVMERVVYNFIPVYCIILPYCLQKLSLSYKKNQLSQMRIVLFLFFVMRFYFVLRSRALPDSYSKLYYYHFLNPFE